MTRCITLKVAVAEGSHQYSGTSAGHRLESRFELRSDPIPSKAG